MTENYCSNCGEPLKENAVVCSDCGKPVPKQSPVCETKESERIRKKQRRKIHAEQVSPRDMPKNKENQSKSAFFALVLSFLFTGLGQVYNGRFWKGIGFMIAVPVGMIFLIVPGLAIWIWNMYDAYAEAEKINRGEQPYKEPTVWEIIGFIAIPFVIIFAFVFISFFFFAIAAV
ncbi:MAG: zinc-ribbon domain-containing protein [Methanosarcinales archaeon]|jgi:TM2 domain-containing membrane protein YozV|nr:zinc-ribbon domain-containing protein [Methanosarcinales archaeon]